MIYPALLHNDSLIGITAPSSGVDINKDTIEEAAQGVRDKGFKALAYTADVRSAENICEINSIFPQNEQKGGKKDVIRWFLLSHNGFQEKSFHSI